MDPGGERRPALEAVQVPPGFQEAPPGRRPRRRRGCAAPCWPPPARAAAPRPAAPRRRRRRRLGTATRGSISWLGSEPAARWRSPRRRALLTAHDRHGGLWRFGRTFGSGVAGLGASRFMPPLHCNSMTNPERCAGVRGAGVRFPRLVSKHWAVMSEIERIRGFLRTVRRRAYWEASLRLAGFTLAGLMLAVLLMALCASYIGPASFWPKLTATVLIILTGAGLAVAALGPVRRLRTEHGVARFVGQRHPPLASDLLSAVELARRAPAPRTGSLGGHPARLLRHRWPASVSPLDVRSLVPFRPVRTGGHRLRGQPAHPAVRRLAAAAPAWAGVWAC